MSASPHILLVDDEPDLLWAVQHSLAAEGYQLSTAPDGAAALGLVHRQRPDLIVLDVTMPHMSGLQLCHILRRDPELAAIPILLLTGHDSIDDRVRGFEEGADDYLPKPFDLRELKARIKALLRRAPAAARAAAPAPAPTKRPLLLGPLSLDVPTCQVTVHGRLVQLTPAEFDLLHYLMQHPNQVFSSQHLLQHVWGYTPEAAEAGLVRWHMMNLRTKIEADPANPRLLRTIPRHGYMLVPGSE